MRLGSSTFRVGFAIGCGGMEELLLSCLQSIRAHCGDAPVHATFDGFEPEDTTAKSIYQLGNVDFTVFGERRGISAVWNSSVEALAEDCDIVVVLNDDTEVGPNFCDLLVDSFASNPEARMICAFDRLTGWSIIPEIRARHDKAWAHDRLPALTTLSGPGGIYGADGFNAYSKWVASLGHPKFLRCRMNGACMALSKKSIIEDGLFDEKFQPPGTSEDIAHYLLLLTKHGPDSLGSAPSLFIHHLRAVTISSYPRDWANARCAENAAYFRKLWPREKWGDIEDWMSAVNALPLNQVEPPLPRSRWW